jgi:membrane protein
MSFKQFRALLGETFADWNEDRVPRMGAALAYYSVFSAAPLLLIAVAIAGFVFGEQAARRELHTEIAGIVGTTAASATEEIVGDVHRNGSGWLGGLIGLAVLLFGASGVFTELQDALNSIWKVAPQHRSGILAIVRDRLLSFLIVAVTGFVLLTLVIVSAVLNGLEHVLHPRTIVDGWLWWGTNQIFTLGLVTMLFAVIYKTIPDTRVEWRDVWLGAAIAALLFTIGKYVIGLYLTRTAVASAFGAAGSVVVLLTWVYYSSQILLFGAEFTRVYAHNLRGAPEPIFCEDHQGAQVSAGQL